jgi:hypothetical protein
MSYETFYADCFGQYVDEECNELLANATVYCEDCEALVDFDMTPEMLGRARQVATNVLNDRPVNWLLMAPFEQMVRAVLYERAKAACESAYENRLDYDPSRHDREY